MTSSLAWRRVPKRMPWSRSTFSDHAFFKQTEFKRLLGNDFLQSSGLPAKILYLVTGRRPRRVTREPALPGLKELLRPDVIEALGNTL